jgi:hypothetical protein
MCNTDKEYHAKEMINIKRKQTYAAHLSAGIKATVVII